MEVPSEIMPTQSAGILPYQILDGKTRVFLVHPGGPYFARKDLGAWSIPKGEADDNEDLLAVAKREILEETGHRASEPFLPLEPVRLKSGKLVSAWACEMEIDPAALVSNSFEIEWPPKSGKRQSFPEVDRGEWFTLGVARDKINPAQVGLVDQLEALLA